MSNLYAVHAYEQKYGGLHGIENYSIIEADNEKEVEEYGLSQSVEVIEDFIIEELYEEIESSYEYKDEEAINMEIENLIAEDTAYDYYKITEPTNLSLEELNYLYYNDPEDFLNKYCK